MNFFKSFMVLSFLLTLTGCVPSSPVEGVVMSSKETGQGIMEHLIQTNRAEMPYYILRVNNNNLRQGAKVILEILPGSMVHRGY